MSPAQIRQLAVRLAAAEVDRLAHAPHLRSLVAEAGVVVTDVDLHPLRVEVERVAELLAAGELCHAQLLADTLDRCTKELNAALVERGRLAAEVERLVRLIERQPAVDTPYGYSLKTTPDGGYKVIDTESAEHLAWCEDGDLGADGGPLAHLDGDRTCQCSCERYCRNIDGDCVCPDCNGECGLHVRAFGGAR